MDNIADMVQAQQAPAHMIHSVRRPAGMTYLFSPDAMVEHETLQCPHCQAHWEVIPGSGRKRGWCFRCGRATCGAQPCVERCVPWEKQMEIMEARARLREAASRALHG